MADQSFGGRKTALRPAAAEVALNSAASLSFARSLAQEIYL